MKKAWIFLWLLLLGTLLSFSIPAAAVCLPGPTMICTTIAPQLLGDLKNCPDCNHAAHLPEICPDPDCLCGACPICGDAVHLPAACRAEDCPCGTGICPWCGDADHLPNPCPVQGCRCGATHVETCPECDHASHLPDICQTPDCLCGKCPLCEHAAHFPEMCAQMDCTCGKCSKCDHADHLPGTCETPGCTCAPPAERCTLCGHPEHDAGIGTPCQTAGCHCPITLPTPCPQCGHFTHLPEACPEEYCVCGKIVLGPTSGVDQPRGQPLLKRPRKLAPAPESLAPPDIRLESKKIAAMQRQQILRIFAGGIVALLMVAVALACWRMR